MLVMGVFIAGTLPGCEDNALCCTESDFQVGGTIALEGEAGVALQAVADISGIASASIDDLTTACRSMAQELDAPVADQKAAEQNDDKRAKMQAWCNLAVTAIGTLKGNGSITIDFQPPACEASVSAKADCQAKCSGSAECDIKANPPTCEGGKLEISCKGSCTAMAGASVSCEGSCTGACEGKCSAEGGSVECAGKCDGMCSASAGGSGIQADGTCQGSCSGTCEVTAPMATCMGTCQGSCDASCEATAEASVKCDGQCDADYEPIKCTGGELKGGCQVEAKCEGNCDASVQAKAKCTPPSLSITVSGAVSAEAEGKLKLVLEANLGLVAALQARFETMVQLVGTVAGNITVDALAEVKPVCIPVVAEAIANAGEDISVTVSATASVMGAVGG